MVRKSLVAIALCVGSFSMAVANPSSGVFVGLNAGLPITTPTYGGAIKQFESILPESGVGYNISLMAGYRQAIQQNMGLRYYIEYNFNQSYGDGSGTIQTLPATSKANITQHLATINADFYYNPTSLFGLYVGIGVGYQSFKPEWTYTMAAQDSTISSGAKGGIAVPLNVGLTFNPTPKHQVAVGAKIPLVGYDYKTMVQTQQGSSEGNAELRSYIVQVGYNYTF